MVVSEAKPYSKTGGLADVTGALPEAFSKFGHSVILVVPRYREVRGVGRPKSWMKLMFGQREVVVGLAEVVHGQRVVLEYAIGLKNLPSFVHAHGWQTGLVSVLLWTCYPFCSVLSQMPSVFTIHNLAYEGPFPLDMMEVLGHDPSLFSIDGLEF